MGHAAASTEHLSRHPFKLCLNKQVVVLSDESHRIDGTGQRVRGAGRRVAVRRDRRLGVVLGFAGGVPQAAGIDPEKRREGADPLRQAVPGRQHRAADRGGRGRGVHRTQPIGTDYSMARLAIERVLTSIG